MYEDFYGLGNRPFDLTPNPRCLYLTPQHNEALNTLRYGMAVRKGVTLLIGEAGLGKTTLIRAALNGNEQPNARWVCINNPTLTRSEFFRLLASGFDLSVEASTSKAVLLIELERLLVDRHSQGLATALIIDEAQSLSDELLEEVRLLANLETETDKLLPVLLVGQPELARRLNLPWLRQLKQRVDLRCDLRALTAQETASYILTRIRAGGGDAATIFTRPAVTLIHERSGGIPRTINVICNNVLVSGFALGERPVSSGLVAEVCRDFDLKGGEEPERTGLLASSVAPTDPPIMTRSDAPAATARPEVPERILSPVVATAEAERVGTAPDPARSGGHRTFSLFRLLRSSST